MALYKEQHFYITDTVDIRQWGRDHGLPDYNMARESLGLKKKESFMEINENVNDTEMSDIDLLVSITNPM